MTYSAGGHRRWLMVAAAFAAVLVGTPAQAAPRVDNPYLGADVYVNPAWSRLAAEEPGGEAVADQPTAVWLDEVADVGGLPGHLDAALAQGADVVQLVLHDLPGRDCHLMGADGEFGSGDLDRYRREFVDPIVDVLAEPAYAGLRVVTVVEPHAIAALATYTGTSPVATPECDTMLANGGYVNGIGYALGRLGELANAYSYLDIAHPGWLGWSYDAAPAVELLYAAATAAGSTADDVRGLIANTADYAVLREPYFAVTDIINGAPVLQSRWVDWRDHVDVESYAAAFRGQLTQRGFPSDIGLLIDTSRNGWGGPARPAGPGPRTSVDAFVDGGRLDRRSRPDNWCNQAGAGLGERPAAAPAPGVDAYVWAKPPGESDGYAGPSTNPVERMCDPDAWPGRQPSGALPDAPPKGEWFPAHFRQLLTNAWPPLT
ncbi:glycoside hydrolase family 6 protein [Streptomyces hainanensis]|uniref:Glucanase n=1 Tax=Streptomyces hainanensis TaxID=402648 RepID=A0A4V2Y396_9ACTN|nr:glycoside hydrolase family 6 protein [Streptomyces hainanensis]TDC75655.1 cellobiohydrolase [Streptomyces hainanensis]